MWAWLIANRIWIILASILITGTSLYGATHLFSLMAKKRTENKKETGLEKKIGLFLLVLSGISLIILVVTMSVVILYQRGTAVEEIGTQIEVWLVEHGFLIISVLIISYLSYIFLKTVLPPLITSSIQIRGKRTRKDISELNKRAQTLSSIGVTITTFVIITLAVLILLDQTGVNIAPFLAGAGIAGVALGFGAQSMVKDFLNGTFIIMEDQYRQGDVTKIAGISGIVEEVTLRRTVLRDLDGIVHTIPNGEITTASNYTKEWSRINLNVTVAYGEDLDHVMAVIDRVGEALSKDKEFSKLIVGTPHALRVDNFGGSGIDIKILGETKPLQQWAVTGELRKRLKKAFDEEGIEIPWPHMKVYFGNTQIPQGAVCSKCRQVNLPNSQYCSRCGTGLSKTALAAKKPIQETKLPPDD